MATRGTSPNDLKVKRSTPILRDVEAHLDLQQLELVFPGDIKDTIRRLQKENDLKLKETTDGFKVIGTLECLTELEHSLAGSDTESNQSDLHILSQKAIPHDTYKIFDESQFSLGHVEGKIAVGVNLDVQIGRFVHFLIDKKEQLVEILNDSNTRLRLKGTSNDKARIKIDKAKPCKVEAEIRQLYEASNTMMVEFTHTVDTQHPFEVANRIRDTLQPELVMLRAVPNTKEGKASPNLLDKSWVVTVLTLNSKGARAQKDLNRIIQQCTSHMDVSTILRKLCNAKMKNPSVRIDSVNSHELQMGGPSESTASPEQRTDGPSQCTVSPELLTNSPNDFNATPVMQTNDVSELTATPKLQTDGSSQFTVTSTLQKDGLSQTAASEQQTNGPSDFNATPQLQTNGQPELDDATKLQINDATSTLTVLDDDTTQNKRGENISAAEDSSNSGHHSNARDILIGDDNVIEYMMQLRNAEMLKISKTYDVNINFDRKEGLLVIHGRSPRLEEAELKLAHLAQDIFLLRTEKIDMSTVPKNIYDEKAKEGMSLAKALDFLVRPNGNRWFIMGPGAMIDSCVMKLKIHFGLIAPKKSRQRKLITPDAKAGPIHHSSNGPASLPASINNINPVAYRATSGLVVYAWEADITKLCVDVVVNAANDRLEHVGGVAYAIARAAGPDLETESKRLMKNYGTLKIAEVRITTAGNMPSKKVFHTVGPQWRDFHNNNKHVCNDHLMNAFYNCLKRAHENKHGSIAFPAISSGVYGVPKKVVAEAAVRALDLFVYKFPFSELKHVHLVDIQQDIIRAFQQELGHHVRFQEFSYSDYYRWLARDALYQKDISKQRNWQGTKGHEVAKQHLNSTYDNFHPNPKLSQHGKVDIINEKKTSVRQGNEKQYPEDMDWQENPGQSIPSSGPDSPHKASKETYLDASLSARSYSQVAAGSSGKTKDIDLPAVHKSEKKPEKLGTKAGTADTAKSKESEEKVLDDCSICLDKPTNPVTLEKCNHVFCKDCIDESFKKTQPKCPNCGVVYGEIRGIQPDGTMKLHQEVGSLPGYSGYGTLVIQYDIPSGVQTEDHPNPGVPYIGTRRTAYLPDCKEGREVQLLLRKAFDARMIFTVGRSSTTGRDNHVIWNCIHHKTSKSGGTNNYGYPDPTYLERVRDELAAQGFK